MTDLAALADAAGIRREWYDAAGTLHRVEDATVRAVLGGMGLAAADDGDCAASLALLADEARAAPLVTGDAGQPIDFAGAAGPARLLLEDGRSFDLPLEAIGEGRVRLRAILEPGYHRLEMLDRAITLAVAPDRCLPMRDLVPDRATWALAVQVYSLRGSPGFGDLGALAQFAGVAGERGADAIAVSPLHALFTADPHRPSPYSPSSRRFLNPWYAGPALPGTEPAGGVGDPAIIDWPNAVSDRLLVLRGAFDHAAPETIAAVAAFVAAGGEALRRHALFEALDAHFHAQSRAHGWADWPSEYRHPAGSAVAIFARDHAREIDFHLFLQWLAERGLAAAQDAATGAGMAIGLIADIALGVDRAGSDAWGARETLLGGVSLGAPPDAFNATGQEWGITGISPRALRTTGFAPFLDMIRAAMRHAGGIRIDHALGLRRLFVVPEGADPVEGTYLAYPEADLLRLIALESHRHRCIVIGEDLGTVAEGFREAIGARGLLGMRVMQFERGWDGGFVPPRNWTRQAVAMTSTHDLPPVAGWWNGRDIEWRERLGMPAEEAAASRTDRVRDRSHFWAMARGEGVASGDEPSAADGQSAAGAAVALVARAPCDLTIIPVEDLLGLEEAPNLPGTIDEHPNWRRRLPVASDDAALVQRMAQVTAMRRGQH